MMLAEKGKKDPFFQQIIKNKTLQVCNKPQKVLPVRLKASHMIFGLLITSMYSKQRIAILNWYCNKVFVWEPYSEHGNKISKHQLLRSLICNSVICWKQKKRKYEDLKTRTFQEPLTITPFSHCFVFCLNLHWFCGAPAATC